MPSVNFYIEKRKDSNGRIKTMNAPIMLYFSYNGKRFQMNTGEKTDFGKWDFNSMRLGKNVPESKQVNTYLDSLEEEIMTLYRESKIMGVQAGRDYFRLNMKNRKTKSGFSFFDVLLKFIDANHNRWSIYTFRKIKTNYNHLRKFSESSGYKVDLDRINADFFKKYIDYFRGLGHSNSTLEKNIMVLKWFLNWASAKGYNRNKYYREFSLPWEARPQVNQTDLYLDRTELMDLYTASLTNERIVLARDIFCFMCFSGLKLTDIKYIRKESVKDNLLKIFMPGDEENITIPLNKFAAEILDRYERTEETQHAFPLINHIQFNRYIKEAGRIAGIGRHVDFHDYRGSDKLIRSIPKYEVLSARTARNTFIFHAVQMGMPLQLIMKYTRHKTISGIDKFLDLVK